MKFSRLDNWLIDKGELKIFNKMRLELMKEELAQKMLDEKLDFLSLEDSLELFESGVAVKTRFAYMAYIEEVEDGYNCELDELFKELDDVYGIYDKNGKFIIDNYSLMIKATEDSFERWLCPAPTYIDLIR